MSTRSGKRLHKASNENIESQIPLKIDRKTRSKRVVENSDVQGVVVKAKKRQNYVTFPSEEDSAGGNSLEDEVPNKSGRALRRYTLKEQNAATEEETKTQARPTRRIKKLSETEGVPEIPVSEDPVVPVKAKGKKNKKKTKKLESEVNNKENVKAGKKKNKRKNSKSNSVEVESNVKRKNDSNVSTDSFQSAAGSPQEKPVTPPYNSSPKHTGEDTLPTQNTSGIRIRSSLKRISELNTSTKAMDVDEDNIEKEAEISVRSSKRSRSSLKPIILDKESTSPDTIEKVDLNTTFEKEPTKDGSSKKKRKSNLATENTDPELTNLYIPKTSKILNTTFEKDDIENDGKSKTNKEQKIKIINASFEIKRSPRKSVNASEKPVTLNGTFDLSPKPDLTKQKSLDSTYEKESKLDSTFDKTDKPSSSGSKSSLISSDATNNSIISLDRSDNSKITDDDSKTENILNTTPLLIESSMEDSRVLESSLKENKTPESLPKASVTPLKREGTFTLDSPSASPKRTPKKRVTLQAAGCTPYYSNGKGSQKRSVLNLTHSIEKSGRRSSLAEAPRTTRVMFCSPTNNPGVATQRKSKVIKSNLKGSNKSFVFDESECQRPQPSRLGRKRSFTHTEGSQASAKRTRLAAEPPPPARARTTSAMAKLTNGATPSKPATPKSEVKTKLPNFAALHARRFERMESLDECQQRKARRAKQLLVPTGSVAVLERSSPRGESVSTSTTPKDVETKLPNFAALHARRFERMESLDECQQRKARRAKQLLVPTGSVAVLERSSPRGESVSTSTTPKDVETKLPNFAALHARRFERMESLDECQQRKARRAKQLLVPTGSVAVLERSSPRGESVSTSTTPKDVETKLPNFAALHARRFERMESLDECQQRKARRAKQLLVPTGSVAVLERSSPRGESVSTSTTPKDVETKLPNFAALHARRFERMESLDECQQRKARRAKQLLVPTGSVAVLERSSPRGESVSTSTTPKDVETKLPNFAALHARRFERMESLDECQQRKARRAKQLLVPTGSVAVLERSSPRGESVSTSTTPKDVETKLPNFAALHARRFERMESLDECQQRKARRAKQLLVPTGSVAVLERSSPRGESVSTSTTPKDVETKLPNFAALHARRFERMESLDECQQRKARRAKQLLVPTGSVAVLERSSPRGESVSTSTTPKDVETKLPNFAALHARRFERMESLDECQQRKARRAKQLLVPTGSVAVLERSSPRGESVSTSTTPKDVETKLPNFAALHARRFERMESLDECQQRKARRAKQLLVPTGSVAVLERSSPRVTLEPKPRDTPPKGATPAKPASKLPTLETLPRGYTRFGFKMQCDVNPFSVPPKTTKPKVPNCVKYRENRVKPNGVKSEQNRVNPNGVKPTANLKREVIQPSLAGATSLRKAVAKQTIMREKSFTLAEKRNESRQEVRTVIRGVRTNRRFDLQMKSRNLNG